MGGMAVRLSKALRSALAVARALRARTLERAGLRAAPPRRTGFIRGLNVTDDFDRMASPEIQEMFEGRQPER
ncbi:MAG: hypothetical protein F4X26_01185 [Chloroflexi bacterium]|nr:hypothetical protein [Chloroflexota bacterium]